MRLLFIKVGSLALVGLTAWAVASSFVGRAGKADPPPIEERTDVFSEIDEEAGGASLAVRAFNEAEPAEEEAPIASPEQSDERVELRRLMVKQEGDLTRVVAKGRAFTRVPGTKYFWAVGLGSSDGKSDDFILEETLTDLPVGEVVEPALDKSLPLDRGTYWVRPRLQLVPPSWEQRPLSDPELPKQCSVAGGMSRVEVP